MYKFLSEVLKFGFLLIFLVGTPVFAETHLQCRKLLWNSSVSYSRDVTQQLRYIVESNGKEKPSDISEFITGRSYPLYRAWFQGPLLAEAKSDQNFFEQLFLKLGPKDAILDGGCGDAFLSDVFFSKVSGPFQNRKESELPTYVGVTYKLNKRTKGDMQERINSGRMFLHTGKYFEDIPNQELVPLGKQIRGIVDYFGIMSYTFRPDIVMKKYLELLASDGMIFFADDPRLNFPKTKVYGFLGYLKQIKGIRVMLTKNISGYPGNGILVTLTGDPIEIPEVRYTSYRKTGLPYVRNFKFTGEFYHINKN